MGLRWITVCVVAAILLAAALSCGHGAVHRSVTAPRTPTHNPQVSIDDVLREIDAYIPPKNVDNSTFAALKAELKRLLTARAGGSKTISTSPTWSGNAVSDLTAMSNGAGTQATVTWTEVLPGDYDNDGEVYITDLIPVVLYYGQRTDSGPDDAHKLVNGDSDPTINEGDLAAVASNYSSRLQGYQVWRGHWNGTSTDWETTPRPNPNAANPDWSADRPSPPPVSTRPAYTFTDDISGLTDKANVRYKVTAYGDGAAGADSNEAVMQPAPVGLADTPWPKFRGNARNTGQSPYVGAQTNHVKWTFQTGGSIGLASPCIGVDGAIYIGSGDGYLYALNPGDGSLKWKSQVGAYETCAAVAADGTVYMGGLDGYVRALNPLDGSEKWKAFLAANGALSSPGIGPDGTVYAGCGVSMSSNDTFFALLPGDGSVKWKCALGQGVSAPPAIGTDGTLYVGGGDVYALSPVDGSTKWSHTSGNGVYSAPALGDDGTIYVAATDGTVEALDPTDGSAKWTYSADKTIYASPGIGLDGTVYVGSHDLKIHALDCADGSTKWEFATGGQPDSSPAIGADGTIYVGGGYLYALASDGSQKWRFHWSGNMAPSPAVGADGTIYAADDSLYVYAIGQ